jgi:hypothetical protein
VFVLDDKDARRAPGAFGGGGFGEHGGGGQERADAGRVGDALGNALGAAWEKPETRGSLPRPHPPPRAQARAPASEH